MNWLYLSSGVFAVLAGIIFYYPAFFYIFLFVLYSVILIILTIFGTVYVHFLLSSKTQITTSHLNSNVLYEATKSSIFDQPKPIKNATNLPIIFGRTVDGVLKQIIEYTLRDYVSHWLSYVVLKPKLLHDIVREDLWNGIQKLRDRAVKIDASKMIAVDMVVRVTLHFEKIRVAQNKTSTENGGVHPVNPTHPPTKPTSSYLVSEEKELEFLKKISEIMIIFLLPRGYSLSPLKNLLSEILSYKLLYPTIKMITSPDYINQKIVQYIETRLAAAAISKRSYEYAASFEDFLKVISNTISLDELLTIRTSIVNDIMQATTMQNLQRAKGLDPDSDEKSHTKSEMAAAVKLKRYIQQLSFAKTQCEKNLAKVGWEGNFSNDLNLSMLDILSTVIGRRYFTLFLEPLKASALVGFYTSVEELKHAAKSCWHQLGAEIFYTYIRAPQTELTIDKSVQNKMKAFLFGDTGPEIFYDVQKTVLKTLEEKYYSSFLLSDEYRQLKNALTSDDFKDISLQTYPESQEEAACVLENDVTLDLTNHSTYARNKLDQLHEKLSNKNQALDALKVSVKPESKVFGILEQEVEWLKSEKRQLEAHLSRTEVWGDHLGHWRAEVQSVEAPDEKDPPQFMILVHIDENSLIDGVENIEGISTGWVILRSLTQFHDLHRKLRPLSKELGSIDLPSNAFKLFFLKNDKSSLEKAKGQIQKYLNFILEDDHLYQSEALYAFLSPSSDHLKTVAPSPKKSKFSLSTLFKSTTTAADTQRLDTFWGPAGFRDNEDEMSNYLEGTHLDSDINPKSQIESDGKDSIAEPLYALMGEIFDMGGVFKWLRRSLISFVQITYGRTINRQIRDSISCLFDESMLHHYASTALKTFWPGGVLSSAYPSRSEDMQEMTANAAKSLLMDNIPELLCNLVGAQTAKHGALKVYDTIQDAKCNKQLFYELIEILMLELFPEIRQLKPVVKHNQQPQQLQNNNSN